MKKHIIKAALAVSIFAMMPFASFAQTSTGTATEVISTVIGTEAVNPSSITGTWTYSQPSVTFETENMLTKYATNPAATKGKTYLQKGLAKAGISEGKVTLVFNNDDSFVLTVGNKTINGTFKLEGNKLTLTYTGVLTGVSKTVTTFASMTSGKLQIAVSADTLLTLVQSVSVTASSASTTLSTVAGLFNSINGMYAGLIFEKK